MDALGWEKQGSALPSPSETHVDGGGRGFAVFSAGFQDPVGFRHLAGRTGKRSIHERYLWASPGNGAIIFCGHTYLCAKEDGKCGSSVYPKKKRAWIC